MPELPEVETTRRGIAPAVVGQRVRELIIRNGALRWPIPDALPGLVAGQTILGVGRRAKYLLLEFANGSAIVHLGMSGQLRVCAAQTPLRKHDHVDLVLDDKQVLRFHDPRRFGCWLWQASGQQHPLLRKLGPEPLEEGFNAAHLYRLSRGRRGAVKAFLMDQAVVVGVGNIYASEALHLAGIHPTRPAGRISLARYQRLVEAVVAVLQESIRRGGTTLRDYVDPSGEPGWFRLQLAVYERAGEGCHRCRGTIQRKVIGQRASYFCAGCQR